MPKEQIVPCTPEEMEALLNASMDDDFFYMLFYLAKTTGRRLGEFYGVQEKEEVGRKVVGQKKVYDKDGNIIYIDKTVPVYEIKGMRWRYGVRVRDIDLERGTMKVWVLKRKKYVQDETILTPEAVRLLKRYINKNRLELKRRIFRKYSYRHIQHKVSQYAKKAGIKHKVSFHNFRHYFISELSRRGWSHDRIAKLTGHKSIGTLSLYDHVIADDLREDAMKVINEL